MGVVNFQHEIRDRELQLMHHSLPGFRLRRQPMARAEIEQDVGGLADHELAGLEERRRKRRRALSRPHHLHHRSHAVAAARHVGIGGAGLLQREPDIFAAALNGRPVIELIAHRRFLRASCNRLNKSLPVTVRHAPCSKPAMPPRRLPIFNADFAKAARSIRPKAVAEQPVNRRPVASPCKGKAASCRKPPATPLRTTSCWW